jgi:hypothetical protein
MNGTPKITTFEKGRITLQFWKAVITNYMKSKKEEHKKPVEATEEKKPTVSTEESVKLQKELNQVELEIIKYIFDGTKSLELRKKKDEILKKLGRDNKAPWKNQNI